MSVVVNLSDDADHIIHRSDVHKKLEKLDRYLVAVNRRLKQLDTLMKRQHRSELSLDQIETQIKKMEASLTHNKEVKL